MTVINTNTSSMIAQNAIAKNDKSMEIAMQRLSTGSRINSAKDDAAGLAISQRMTSQISGLKMAARNANDAISLLQTIEGATKEISNMLGRMRELAVQAGSGTYTDTDRAALNLEYQALLTEMDRIAGDTEWNGGKILAGSDPTITTNLSDAKSLNIHIGSGANQTMALSVANWRPTVAVDGSMALDGTGKSGVDDQAPETSLVAFADRSIDANGGAGTKTLTVSLGGLVATITNGTNNAIVMTDDALADLFANLEDGATAGNTTTADGALTATWSGQLSGFNTSAVIGDTTVKFTSTGTSTSNNTLNVTDLDITMGGTTSTTTAPGVTTVAGTKANQSAYGSGILYVGGNTANGGGTAVAPTAMNITSAANAAAVITELDNIIDGAAAERAKYGAYMSRLQHASDNLNNVATNTAASRSQIQDADYAAETTELARTQIISQASTAMLAQANQVKQTVLSLLK
ncbi:flagellin [Gammaproteobacteria bacterium]|nr:flagellin [Gammaproteobacteria bacterium]